MSSGYGPGGGFKPPAPPRAPTGYMQQSVVRPALAYPGAVQPSVPTAAAPAPASNPYDLSSDPALQQILAQDAAARANAQAAALAAEKQLAIQLGDASGIIGDRNTALEAAKNPYSTLASLAKGYKQTQWNTDQSLNQNNLYFSGDRAKQLASDAYNYQDQRYTARQQALMALSTIQANLASSLYGYNQADAAGYQNAYTTATNNATTYGYNPGAGATTAAPVPSSAAGQPVAPASPFPQSSVASALSQPKTQYPQAAAVSPAFRQLQQVRNGKAA